MSTIDSSEFMSPSLIEAVDTNVDSAMPSSRYVSSKLTNQDAWQHLIDYQLIEWGIRRVDEEGIEEPSRNTIQLAIGVAQSLGKQGLPAPDSVVPDANGGIVFERREKDVSEVIHVWDDGTIEYQLFHGTRLIERRPL